MAHIIIIDGFYEDSLFCNSPIKVEVNKHSKCTLTFGELLGALLLFLLLLYLFSGGW